MNVRQNTWKFYGEIRDGILCRDPEVIISGPRDTGKTLGFLWKLDALARKYENASLVIARRLQVDLWSTVVKSFQDHILCDDPTVRTIGGQYPAKFIYPTGATIWTAGLDKSSRVLSAEHDVVYVNQAEECAVKEWENLLGAVSGRAGHMPYSQVIGDCNPATPSHWIRQRMKAGMLTMFNSRHENNPALYDRQGNITPAGRSRLAFLDRYTGAAKKRYRYGLWAAPEGAIYGNSFDGLHDDGAYGKHMVRSFEIPLAWPRVVGIDPAGAKRAALWLAFDGEGNRLHVYRESVLPHGSTVQHFAGQLKTVTAGEPVFAWICGAKSERDWRVEFIAAGLPVVEPPVADFWVGVDRVLELLDTDSLVIHDCCKQLLSEIEEYHRKLDKRTNEFVDQVEDKEKFHLLDALRYSCVWLTHADATQSQIVYNPVRIGLGM